MHAIDLTAYAMITEVLEANGVKPSGRHNPNKTVPVPPASRRRKRASGQVPSNLTVEEELQQPPSKRRRPTSEIPEQAEPEVFASGSHYEDDEVSVSRLDPFVDVADILFSLAADVLC